MPLRRLPVLGVALALLASLLVIGLPQPASASSGAESDLVARINAERSKRGLGALSVSGDLQSVARDNSARMASNGKLAHSSNLGGRVSNWSKLAENVGYGPSAKTVHRTFMGSGSHAGNILDPAFTQVGVGVIVAGDGTLWVTQVFRRPKGATGSSSSGSSSSGSSSSGSSSSGSSSSGSSGRSAPPTPAPEPEPEPEPVVVVDRLTVTLARIEVAGEGAEAPVGAILEAAG